MRNIPKEKNKDFFELILVNEGRAKQGVETLILFVIYKERVFST
ncbi:MAG: hypothetical protein ACJASM_001009 [Salibacteraceae bacterium]|jgi:hypothetical protein|tara:strand:- start:612 stop:743 length:132 start_codon:yes stop_codon:yes gene_type:complete